MKLARVIYRNNNPWGFKDGAKINPPIGTIVQYEYDGRWVDIYFPGVQQCVTMPGSMFSTYFEDLDNEAS